MEPLNPQPTTAFIGLGSNLGQRLDNLRRACAALGKALGPLKCASEVFQTEPRLDLDQPAFLNAVVQVQTCLEPLEVLDQLQRIEQSLGRIKDPTRPKGPRLVDLDLLLLGQRRWADDRLQVPHPGLHLRRFVLAPLAQIAPHRRVPGFEQTVAELLASCPDQGWIESTGWTLDDDPLRIPS